METYQNCEAADEGQQMTRLRLPHPQQQSTYRHAGVCDRRRRQAGAGQIASAVQKAIEITAHG